MKICYSLKIVVSWVYNFVTASRFVSAKVTNCVKAGVFIENVNPMSSVAFLQTVQHDFENVQYMS